MLDLDDSPILITPLGAKIHTVSMRPTARHALMRVHFVWFGPDALLSVRTAIRRIQPLNPSLTGAQPCHLWWSLGKLPKLTGALAQLCKSCDGGVGMVAPVEVHGTVIGVWCPGQGGARSAKLYPADNAWPDQTLFAFAER